jgi:zinc transport system substrate-binding protein
LLTAKKIQYNIVLLFVALPLLLSASWAQATAQKPLLITTIKPLAIIAKAAVGDQAQVEYLQSAVQSAHEVSLPVSALIRLGQADLVLWIGKGFEARISKPMALLPETKLITVMDLPMLPAKSSAEEAVSSGESEDDHHSHHHHDHLQFDPHIWLNPANGNILANSIQQRLKLPLSPIISAELVEQLKAELQPVKDRKYLTHHDAYAHFATAFDLTEGLSIRDASGASQGAKSQYKLRQQALSVKASCIFIEPQYADKDARILARELQLPLQILDQQGFDQPLTADGYSQFMAGLVSQFKACFE